MTSDLVLTTFDCVPEHMAQLSAIAKSKGLSRGALLRLLISQYVNRAAKKQNLKK
jgi:hypothetical protein